MLSLRLRNKIKMSALILVNVVLVVVARKIRQEREMASKDPSIKRKGNPQNRRKYLTFHIW